MRPSLVHPLLGILLCLLLAFDAVGTAVAAVRSLGGGCPHAQAAGGTMAMPAHRADPPTTQAPIRVSRHRHDAAAAPAATHALHAAHTAASGDAHAAMTHLSAADGHATQASAPECHSIASPQAPPAADDREAEPADSCDCDDGGCACPAACSLVLASPAGPMPGASAPGQVATGPRRHARPSPPQPDALRPPIG